MADYIDIYSLSVDETLQRRVAVAIFVACRKVADALGTDGPYDNRMARLWAQQALDYPVDEAKRALNYILAGNVNSSLDQITRVTNEQLQSQVNTAMPYLIKSRALE